MIPIDEAIETGVWLLAEFEATQPFEPEANDGHALRFRLRVTNFSKIDLSTVDSCEELSVSTNNNVWKLDFEVVSLCKRECEFYWIMPRRLFISDEEGFEFPFLDDSHLRLYSDYAKHSGLESFFAYSALPKIKRAGAFPYELPDDFEKGFLFIRGGTLREA